MHQDESGYLIRSSAPRSRDKKVRYALGRETICTICLSQTTRNVQSVSVSGPIRLNVSRRFKVFLEMMFMVDEQP